VIALNEKLKLLARKVTDFTLESYRELLLHLRNQYHFVRFPEFARAPVPKLILRHDIDASLEPAIRFATLENKLGIKATYFVAFSMKYYSLHDESGFDALRKISSLGHEIGLHYDSLAYRKYGRKIRDVLDSEMELLSLLVRKPVRVIARHNVTISGKDPFEGCRRPLNAYNPEFFKDALYLSDSCRSWYLKDLKRLIFETPQEVQLLIHPLLWTEKALPREQILDKFFADIERGNSEYLKAWKMLWRGTPRIAKFDEEKRLDPQLG
jgi:hypothetical protein